MISHQSCTVDMGVAQVAGNYQSFDMATVEEQGVVGASGNYLDVYCYSVTQLQTGCTVALIMLCLGHYRVLADTWVGICLCTTGVDSYLTGDS